VRKSEIKRVRENERDGVVSRVRQNEKRGWRQEMRIIEGIDIQRYKNK
jgi:ABC-type uncharacterized transport system ATPase component